MSTHLRYALYQPTVESECDIAIQQLTTTFLTNNYFNVKIIKYFPLKKKKSQRLE